ncbi:MAG: hypothetical protein IT365_09890 [Candidatus Hydrogenedentes bacterium]|nr:hypothetical protein [Candidatus Hydrogenedentota bacterium]
MELPAALREALRPLFDAFPLESAMESLVVTAAPPQNFTGLVEDLVGVPVLSARPALCAGLWLYVDDLERSHVLSQGIDDSTGSFWHGIMHRREGDFSNSHYWFRRVGTHPAMKSIPGYDAHGFIDEVERRRAQKAPDLVALQRKEWETLFTWCAERDV